MNLDESLSSKIVLITWRVRKLSIFCEQCGNVNHACICRLFFDSVCGYFVSSTTIFELVACRLGDELILSVLSLDLYFSE